MKHDELTLEKQCRELARANGWACWKNEKNGNVGVPDDTFVSPDGRVVFVEFKTATGRQSVEQRFWQAYLGDLYVIIRDVDTFEEQVLQC